MIEITSDTPHLWVQMDASILPGEVYLPDGRMTWRVPAGEHRLAYCSGAFRGSRSIVTARAMTAEEIAARRNIARNPSDLRGDTDFFPPLYRQCGDPRRIHLRGAQCHRRHVPQ